MQCTAPFSATDEKTLCAHSFIKMAVPPIHHGVRSLSSCLTRYRWNDAPKRGGGHQEGGGALVEGDVGRVDAERRRGVDVRIVIVDMHAGLLFRRGVGVIK